MVWRCNKTLSVGVSGIWGVNQRMAQNAGFRKVPTSDEFEENDEQVSASTITIVIIITNTASVDTHSVWPYKWITSNHNGKLRLSLIGIDYGLWGEFSDKFWGNKNDHLFAYKKYHIVNIPL